MRPVTVVVVEDSVTQRALLVAAIEEGGRATVVGEAGTTEEAVAAVGRLAPEVVTMDLEIPGNGTHGPGGGGIAAITEIMFRCPTPILVLSAHGNRMSSPAIESALAAGAADVTGKPPIWTPEHRDALQRQLLTLRGVSVIRRLAPRDPPAAAPRRERPERVLARAMSGPDPAGGAPSSLSGRPFSDRRPIVGLVASTGGPLALQRVITSLSGVPAPVVVVQHLQGDFSAGFAQWLGQTTRVPTHLLTGPTVPLDGHVYVAPGGRHVRLDDDGLLILDRLPELLHCPSADELLHSLAAFAGAGAIAAVLTGMGSDGAAGLRAVAAAGGACFAQDAESCAVFGMPRAAVQAGAVVATTTLGAIGPAILSAAHRRQPASAPGRAS